MTEKIVDLHPKATCTGSVPSECPDRFKSDNLREIAPVDETMARLGLDSVSWPVQTEGSRRVGLRKLKELRDQHMAWAALLTEIIGDEPEDFDPRGGAA